MMAPWPPAAQAGSAGSGFERKVSGKLYLVPNALDVAARGKAVPDLQEGLPLGVIRVAARLAHWVAENAKATRAFLKRVGSVVPLAQSLQSISILELPRTGAANDGESMHGLLLPARQGHDVGLISEAGLPAVADPGAGLVSAAHAEGIEVIALPGASSLLLALAASGLEGQNFAFVGYLPVDAAARAARIRELEAHSRQTGQTQLVIETPYRNPALLAALLATLAPSTRLAVGCGLTQGQGWNHSAPVAKWKSARRVMPADVPATFCFRAEARQPSHANASRC